MPSFHLLEGAKVNGRRYFIYWEKYVVGKIRLIHYDELEELLYLYKHLHADDPELVMGDSSKLLWDQIYNDKNLYYIVADEEGKLVSSCTLAVSSIVIDS